MAVTVCTTFFLVLDALIATAYAKDEVTRLSTKLEIREQQLIACLNGKAIGYTSERGGISRYIVCRPAEEIESRETGS